MVLPGSWSLLPLCFTFCRLWPSFSSSRWLQPLHLSFREQNWVRKTSGLTTNSLYCNLSILLSSPWSSGWVFFWLGPCDCILLILPFLPIPILFKYIDVSVSTLLRWPLGKSVTVLYDFITYKMQEGACCIALLGMLSNLAPRIPYLVPLSGTVLSAGILKKSWFLSSC